MSTSDGQAPESTQSPEQAAEQALRALQRFQELSVAGAQRPLTDDEVAEVNEFTARHPSLDRLLGVRYRVVEPQRIQIALTIREDHLQPWGITNGGVYSSLGETAGSMASFLAAGSGPIVMGTSNETHFLRPSSAGDVIVSTATPENMGRTSHLWRIEHRNEGSGKLCALTFLKTTVVVDKSFSDK
ncbi:PaaI family thioesterase [Corynebacterium falsenii]|uniref:PaaI family thioesterase n=1 Tax=Corynebacterium falsenii TaxID=108486 RepID=UPI003FD0B5BA